MSATATAPEQHAILASFTRMASSGAYSQKGQSSVIGRQALGVR